MASSTIPDVIDYLVATLTALPATQGILVSDGFPAAGEEPTDLVVVGGNVTPTADGTQVWAQIGHLRREEDYGVEISISCYRGGTEQKPSRDAAFAILRAFDEQLIADPTLGGLVRIVLLSQLGLKQTDYTDAAQGRTATITVTVRIQNRIS